MRLRQDRESDNVCGIISMKRGIGRCYLSALGFIIVSNWLSLPQIFAFLPRIADDLHGEAQCCVHTKRLTSAENHPVNHTLTTLTYWLWRAKAGYAWVNVDPGAA